MGYDYIRSTTLPNSKLLALGVSLVLIADTLVVVFLFFQSFDYSTQKAYQIGLEQYDIKVSVFDVLIFNLLKACLLCTFWSFAILKFIALLATTGSIAFLMAKFALFKAWSDHTAFAILLISLPASAIEFMAVLRTKYTKADPDSELAEKVEEEERMLGESSLMKSKGKVLMKNEKQHRNGAKREEDYMLMGDDDDEDEEQGDAVADGGGEVGKTKQRPSMLYLLYRYASPDYGLLIAGFFFIIVSSLFKLAIPNFASQCLTLIIQGASKSPPTDTFKNADFHQAVFYFVLSSLGLAFFASLRIWCTAKAEVRLVARLQRILFFAIIRQDIQYFDDVGTGALTSRLISDCTLLGAILTTNCNVAIQSSINLVGSTAYLFFLDVRLAAAYLALVIAFMMLTRVVGFYAKHMQKKIQTLKAEANTIAEQSISLVRLVRAFATEDWEKTRYDRRTLRSVEAELRTKMIWTLYVPVVFIIQNGLSLTVILFGGYLVGYERGMSAAELTAFYFYSTTITDAMQSLADNILSILTGLGAGEAIMDIISKKPTIPVKGGMVPRRPANGEVVFEDICLTYTSSFSTANSLVLPTKTQQQQALVIQNMNLTIQAGERVAIVGLSGSGKSSIISLLLRYYAPTSGKIFFSGHDIAELDPRWLKANIGVVTQDPMLFGISIRENIAYGRDDVDDEEIEEAASMASIHEFIMTLPMSYSTVVGERGITLSGGQRQRIAIARALLRKPKLLILDEATSALDAQSEAEVQEALHELYEMTDMTMICIAHRLSTVQDADRILVMSKGQIVEEGTHTELLSFAGVYHALIQHQLQEEAIRASAQSPPTSPR